MPLTLDSPVLAIDGKLATRRMGAKTKGPEAHVVLAEAFDIHSVQGLLHHYPRRYIDRSRVVSISHLKPDAFMTVIARVKKVNQRPIRNRPRQTLVTVIVSDGSGELDLTFFNQPWAARQYREGQEVAVSGIVGRYAGRPQMMRQEVEFLRGSDEDLVHTGRITPVHRAAEGISTRTIRELVHAALRQLPPMPDEMPDEIVRDEGLGSFDRATRDIHFPADEGVLESAIERLKFDELFTLELGVAFRKHRVAAEAQGVAHRADGQLTQRLGPTLPFVPTQAQRRAMAQIGTAMAAAAPMNVLLQGDVGSGKTLVALHACLVAIQSGHQAAIMVPTEVLAAQHERSARALLEALGAVRFLDTDTPTLASAPAQASLLEPPDGEVQGAEPALTYALLSSAVTGKDRARIVEGVASGAVDLVIGTHALVQEGVAFSDLSLAVVDEQHRFGLHQRMALKSKGGESDVLIMTATPIPRTLALTYYGDLDVVVLDELPQGRLPVRTSAARTADERSAAYDLVRAQVGEGRQAFVVCAAIDDDNRTQVKAAEAEAERLAADVFPDLAVDLLHGRMRPNVKQEVMERFVDGSTDVLIATTVIEVGVDVPNATVMLVENAERFGLAQLHQLRGRIGRGAFEGRCVLFDGSNEPTPETRARIDAMVRTTDGFALADEDLRLRGEGTLFDTKQSGMPDLQLARLAEDADLVRRARARAFAVIDADPGLDRHPELFAQLKVRFQRSIDWLFRS